MLIVNKSWIVIENGGRRTTLPDLQMVLSGLNYFSLKKIKIYHLTKRH